MSNKPAQDLAAGVVAAAVVASVLEHDPEADRVTDELVQKKIIGWTTKPLTRRAFEGCR